MMKTLADPFRSSRILSDDEIKYILRAMNDAVPPYLLKMAKAFGVDIDKTIRFSSLSHQCQTKREELGWSVKEVAAKLGIPQYRVRAIEAGTLSEFSQKEVLIYIEVLGIQNWFQNWRQANPRAFHSLPLNPDRSSPWAKKVSESSV